MEGGEKSSSGYNFDENAKKAPRIVLMGSRRSGKSSIEAVVFSKEPPHSTMFMSMSNEPTMTLATSSALARCAILEIPGSLEDALCEQQNGTNGSALSPFEVFSSARVLVYVIDAEGDLHNQCAHFARAAQAARKISPRIALEVFVHKVDGDLFLTEEQKQDVRHKVDSSVRNEIDDDSVEVSFSLTSIYDHSIFEAFCKVISKWLVPQRKIIEGMLDALVASSDMDKSFLFDVSSKVYIATDSAFVDSATLELCADAVDVALDVGLIYSAKASPTDTCSAVVKLSKGMALVLDEVDPDKQLAVVCLLRSDKFEKRGLIEYNLACFKTALTKLAHLNANHPTEHLS